MVLDSNLPTYFFRASTDRAHRYDYTLLFSQNDSDPEPRYTLRHPNPDIPIAKNCYACALFDAHNDNILYGEVLLKPDWQQPTLSAHEIRQQTLPPPPIALIPLSFTVQLYNPPSQVVITEKRSQWGNDTYAFEIPQWTFREPSTSAIDMQTHDPTADATTPQFRFIWKKDGKLTKDLVCYLTGRSTSSESKKKGGKEPDIVIAKLENYRDLVIYESNLQRVEIEDLSGFEYVLLLSAATIRDIYCGQRKNGFNVGEANLGKNSTGGGGGVVAGFLGRKKSTPNMNAQANPTNIANNAPSQANTNSPYGSGPQLDPRSKWEIEAEAARLKQQQDAERRAQEAQKRERERIDAEAAMKLQKQMEKEEKEKRKKAAEIDKETARLLKKYGDQSSLFTTLSPTKANTNLPTLALPPSDRPPPVGSGIYQRPFAQSSMNLGVPKWNSNPGLPPRPEPHSNSGYGRPVQQQQQPQQQQPPKSSSSPYGNLAASVSSFFHAKPSGPKPKKSTTRLRRLSDAPEPQPGSLQHKRSSLF